MATASLDQTLLHQDASRDPEGRRLKAWIVSQIAVRTKAEGLTQTEAAERMNLKQPDLSALMNGKLDGFSVERLVRCLSELGGEVWLTVKTPDGSEDKFVLGRV